MFDYSDDDIQRTEIFCHECGHYIQFNINLAVNGRYVLNCPGCGHEHYRYVEDGRVTDRRWGSSNLPTITANASTTTWSIASIGTSNTYGSGTWTLRVDTTTGGW